MIDFNIYLAILAVAAAGALSCMPYVNIASRYLVTFVHELGHGVIGVFVGGGFPRITLTLSEEGLAMSRFRDGPTYALRRLIHLLAGYSAPVTTGTALILAAYFGFIEQATWTLVAMGVISILANIMGGPFRNWFGILFSILYTVLTLYLVLASEEYAYLLVLFMGTTFLVRGVIDFVDIGCQAFTEYFVDGDLLMLEEEMGFGGPRFWFTVLTLVTIACVLGQVYLFVVWLS